MYRKRGSQMHGNGGLVVWVCVSEADNGGHGRERKDMENRGRR